MLTQDSQQIERQRRTDLFRTTQEQAREALRSNLRQKEATVARDGELITSSLDAQVGTPLLSADLIRRLEKMNRNLHFEVSNSNPALMGVYVIENAPDIITGISPRKRFIVGMMRGWMPERTVRHVKRSRVPDPDGEWKEVEEYAGETRGWRRVLVELLRHRLITTSQIDAYFPANQNSKAWKDQTT